MESHDPGDEVRGDYISERRKDRYPDKDGAMAVLRNQYKIRGFPGGGHSLRQKIDKTLPWLMKKIIEIA